MGIEAYNLAGALTLIISQRLARRLCIYCRDQVSSAQIPAVEKFTQQLPDKVWVARGCSQCNDGYRGRIALVELLPVSAEIAERISAGANVREIEAIARQAGSLSLLDNAMTLLERGETSLDELRRVLS
jgi:type II secretory ATPase GspE/PulE/Tfp pilus assembly ATPase PilB-like protein